MPYTSQNGHHQKIHKQQMLERLWREGNTLHCWWECKPVKPLETAVRRFLKKLKTELPPAPAVPLLGIYPEKNMIQKPTCTPVFTAALLTIAKMWKQPKCPSAEERMKMWYMYTVEYYSAIKKEWNAICSNMDGPKNHHTEWSQRRTIKWHPLYMESKKNDTNELTYTTKINSQT